MTIRPSNTLADRVQARTDAVLEFTLEPTIGNRVAMFGAQRAVQRHMDCIMLNGIDRLVNSDRAMRRILKDIG